MFLLLAAHFTDGSEWPLLTVEDYFYRSFANRHQKMVCVLMIKGTYLSNASYENGHLPGMEVVQRPS